MWKLLCKLSIAFSLSACSQQVLDIFLADDLNVLLPDKEEQTFFVKKNFLQNIDCQEIENWARNNLSSLDTHHRYRFVKYDDELTLAGNPWLKKDAGAIIGSYTMCSMDADNKKCYYCREG